MKKKNYHVVRHTEGWATKKEGNSSASSVHSKQEEAIKAGTQMSKNQGVELFIHNRKGQIRERNSFGKDPFPPRG